MKKAVIDNNLVITLPNRIDSSNANEVGCELEDILATKTSEKVVFDATPLTYISSAGLRVILKCKKKENCLKIINVSSEVYEIFEMTGFTEIIEIEKAYRVMNVDGCEVIGKGAKGIVYRYNSDTVLKVYNNANSIDAIKNERRLAKRAFVLGIPTAISFDLVKVGDKFGTVYELLDADSFSGIIAKDSSKIVECSKAFADMLYLIHHTEVNKDELPNAKEKYYRYWSSTIYPLLDEKTKNKLEQLLKEIPEPSMMLHCDYHTNNIMLQNDEPIVIDMDTLSYGHPLFDLGSICFTYKTQLIYEKEAVESFLNLPSSSISKIWEYFLPQYLRSSDEEFINNVEKKISCFSYLRFINHIAKRCSDNKDDEKLQTLVKEFIKELEDIDSFLW